MMSLSALGQSIVVVAGVYAAFCAFIYFSQSSLLYYPERRVAATPEHIGLAYEEVRFATDDELTLAGWYVPSAHRKGVILFCHGNAGNISHRLDTIKLFHRLGYCVFIFDYRGYGESQGEPTEEGTYLDVEAAWRYLTNEKEVPPSRIILFGRSLGGAVAAHLASRQQPRAWILESTFTSVKDMASSLYPFLPARFLCRFNYDTLKLVRNNVEPLLIVHSRDDEMIPFSHGQALFEAAGGEKSFLEISGDHNNGFMISGEKYFSGLEEFLDRLP